MIKYAGFTGIHAHTLYDTYPSQSNLKQTALEIEIKKKFVLGEGTDTTVIRIDYYHNPQRVTIFFCTWLAIIFITGEYVLVFPTKGSQIFDKLPLKSK